MLVLWFFLLLGLAQEPAPSGRTTVPEAGSLECDVVDPCRRVLPGAVRFERVDGKPYATGYDADGERVGWVVLSNDVVDIKGYSGKPMSTLIGVDNEAHIAGARVVHHSEPILLVGIPEQKLHDFVDAYTGIRVDAQMAVGRSDDAENQVDIVSGATVTVLAQNQTILEAARALAADVGVIETKTARPGHFVTDEPWGWQTMVSRGALGHLQISQETMGGDGDKPFIDLWFGLADAPQIGIPLLGELRWKHAMEKLQPGEHLFVAFNDGTWSFKGSGFVRGGIFDRFRLEQGLRTQTFRDMDYLAVDTPPVADAPFAREGGLFVIRDGNIDPGEPYDLVFVASVYNHKGAFSRDFQTFEVTHRLPGSVYVMEGHSPEFELVAAAWSVSPIKTGIVGAWLLLITGLFARRRWLTGDQDRLQRIHIGVMSGSFVLIGLVLNVQPSVTQLLTVVGSTVGEWRWTLFLSEPSVFLSWVFIAGVLFTWGRGVFCGWACPYGAMNELTFKLAQRLGLPELQLPDAIHFKARYARYVVLIGLVAAYLYDAQLGEQLAEVEPFKSTFYVAPWSRHPALFGWWLVLLGASVFMWRPYCQYLCPLGAGLAAPSYVRISGPYRRSFCSKCKICTRTCEPRAIDANGVINGADCLNCMECEANWQDEYVCPPLVKIRRDKERAISSSVASKVVS